MPLEAFLWLGGSLGIAVLVIAAMIYLAGRKDAQTDQLKQENEVSNAQKDALANQPRTDDALADKLRNGGF